jgi:hypothetical protein
LPVAELDGLDTEIVVYTTIDERRCVSHVTGIDVVV